MLYTWNMLTFTPSMKKCGGRCNAVGEVADKDRATVEAKNGGCDV